LELNAKLATACRESNFEEVKALVEGGASVNHAEHSQSVLHMALNRNADPQLISYLIQKRAAVDFVYRDYGCHHSTNESCFQKVVQILKVLGERDSEILSLFLAEGANPDELTNDSSGGMRSDYNTKAYPIHSVARHGSVRSLKLLLEAKATIDHRYKHYGGSEYGYVSNTSETALHKAIESESLEKVKLLLHWKADINAERHFVENLKRDPNKEMFESDPRSDDYVSNIKNVLFKQTPLHIALMRKNKDLVRCLIVNGARSSIPFTQGEGITIEKSQTSLELCCNDEVFESALDKVFRVSDFVYLNPEIQLSIRTFLLCDLRNWRLPKDVIFRIISCLLFYHGD